jgi:hypothetical protein
MDAEAARMAEAFLRDFGDDGDEDLELQEEFEEEGEGEADGWEVDEADDDGGEYDNPFAAAAAELDEEQEAVVAAPKVRVRVSRHRPLVVSPLRDMTTHVCMTTAASDV